MRGLRSAAGWQNVDVVLSTAPTEPTPGPSMGALVLSQSRLFIGDLGTLGRWVFWLMFIGFNVTFFMMHLTGLRGMPRRIASYPEGLGWDRLNMLSSIGSYILAAGVVLFVFDFFWHQRHGLRARRNPWARDGAFGGSATYTMYGVGYV